MTEFSLVLLEEVLEVADTRNILKDVPEVADGDDGRLNPGGFGRRDDDDGAVGLTRRDFRTTPSWLLGIVREVSMLPMMRTYSDSLPFFFFCCEVDVVFFVLSAVGFL